MAIKRRKFLQGTAATAATVAAAPWMARSGHASEAVRVAELHDLSGVIDIFGISCNEAFNLAVEETNAAGGLLGRPVEVSTYDTQSNNQLYAQYAQRA